jgi:cytochrome c peroxidase
MRFLGASLPLVLGLCSLLSACEEAAQDGAIEVELSLPAHFPAPLAPEENPLRAASIELGRHLFYDTRLSVNGTIACASCHKQEFAFADNLSVSLGATGDQGVLNAPSLANVIYAQPLTWAHGEIRSIEDQLVGPMFGESPLEMGLTGNEALVSGRLAESEVYALLFEEAYPGEPVDLDRARYALASFVRSLVSSDSPFDQFLAGDSSAISAAAVRGSELFYSDRLGCSHCHVGFAFTTAVHSRETTSQRTTPFHNIGLYNVDGQGGYPSSAQGLVGETGIDTDMGRFRVPSLRNIALTAPYGHDGSVESLEAFLQIYEAGGRNLEEGIHQGDGRQSPLRSKELKSFTLDATERADLIAFLHSLTDTSFVSAEEHSSPW